MKRIVYTGNRQSK